jgi:hypothetical protein
MASLLALALVALAVLVSLRPLLAPEPEPQPEPGPALEEKRADVVRALRDVELDYAMDKITEEDRDRLRADLEGRAVRILAAIDEADAAPARRDPPA